MTKDEKKPDEREDCWSMGFAILHWIVISPFLLIFSPIFILGFLARAALPRSIHKAITSILD